MLSSSRQLPKQSTYCPSAAALCLQVSTACRFVLGQDPFPAKALPWDRTPYAAPELLSGRRNDPSPACDVWSFGVVLWEVRGHRCPLPARPPAAPCTRTLGCGLPQRGLQTEGKGVERAEGWKGVVASHLICTSHRSTALLLYAPPPQMCAGTLAWRATDAARWSRALLRGRSPLPPLSTACPPRLRRLAQACMAPRPHGRPTVTAAIAQLHLLLACLPEEA